MTTMAAFILAVETSFVLRADVAAMSDEELSKKFGSCHEVYRDRAGTIDADIAHLHQLDLLAEYLRRTEARTEQPSVQS